MLKERMVRARHIKIVLGIEFSDHNLCYIDIA